MAMARVTAKGQVTIPVEVRKSLDIKEGDDLLFEVGEGGEARIRVVKRRSGRMDDAEVSDTEAPVAMRLYT